MVAVPGSIYTEPRLASYGVRDPQSKRPKWIFLTDRMPLVLNRVPLDPKFQIIFSDAPP
jgi:hypothetical protein